ncbi:hypothetical protein P691DRAFT_774822 [Macrolepiota fuliginosa MF-IS2]|uniref:Protein kibra n=1 Tax=Macrolepiota fuliginosa MF-IS2 TaxID=1400762 RepID=A0A9P5XD77_9AGAR|nr:hypothetical protein P691DRAFT_774822 [Macrolepiota fuliginosa MF-IS2]
MVLGLPLRVTGHGIIDYDFWIGYLKRSIMACFPVTPFSRRTSLSCIPSNSEPEMSAVPQEPLESRISVTVVGADVDGRQALITTVIVGAHNPYWNETFDVIVNDTSVITVEVFDRKRHSFLGAANFKLSEVFDLEVDSRKVLISALKYNSEDGIARGKLAVSLSSSINDPPMNPSPEVTSGTSTVATERVLRTPSQQSAAVLQVTPAFCPTPPIVSYTSSALSGMIARRRDAGSRMHYLDAIFTAMGGPPLGWEMRLTSKGRAYYFDRFTLRFGLRRDSSWVRCLDVTVTVDENLPFGWGLRLTPRGRPYYVDHFTRTSTWKRPCSEDGDSNLRKLDTMISEIDDLPFGWDLYLNLEGRPYYFNRFTREQAEQKPHSEEAGSLGVVHKAAANISSERGILVTVVGADGLRIHSSFGPPNAFAVLTVGDKEVHVTTVIEKTHNPYWNEAFHIMVNDTSVITVEVFDRNRPSFLGAANFRISEVFDSESLYNPKTLTPVLKYHNEDGIGRGKLVISLLPMNLSPEVTSAISTASVERGLRTSSQQSATVLQVIPGFCPTSPTVSYTPSALSGMMSQRRDAGSRVRYLDVIVTAMGGLPLGWEMRQTSRGSLYYFNPLISQFVLWRQGVYSFDAAIMGENLPFGWKLHLTPKGHPYYMDHFTHTSTSKRPRSEDGDSNLRKLDTMISEIDDLPFGWDLCLDLEGCPYYFNRCTRKQAQQKPHSEEADSLKSVRNAAVNINAARRLPPGWEMRPTPGGFYYVDHNTRTTTWYRPGFVIMEYAELDSIPRRPVPRCHPGTRVGLIEGIMERVIGESVHCDMVWVNGPAGAGKTALAQTIGEKMASEFETLGAALFLSRACRWDDPSLFWVSIADQLTNSLNGYEREIGAYRSDPSAIRGWDVRTQFDALLYKPLFTIEQQRKLVILIDGLDECRGEEEQCEIIECILKALRGPGHFPVRWLIFSRPEPHLKRAFGAAESENLCCIKEVVIDDPETQSDIRLYLDHGFKRIAKRFIGDPVPGDPVSQLQDVIGFLAGAPNTNNPLDYVDSMYQEIILRGRPELLPVSLDVLGTCAVCPPLPVLYFSYLIGFDLQQVYAALRSLHSVIAVPSEQKVAEESLRYFHTSFTDFLTNPNRSRSLMQDPRARRVQLTKACFVILCNTEVFYARGLSQSPPPDDTDASSPLSISYHISIFASSHTWEMCALIPNPDEELLCQTVCAFDFRRLKTICETILPRPFIDFLRWLHQYTKELPELADLIRTRPRSDTDTQFIQAFEYLSLPLDLASQPDEKELESPRYALLGIDEQTVAILATHETVMVYSAEGIDDL